MDLVASISSNPDFQEYGIVTLNHTLRKKGKHFKGKAEHQTNPDNRNGEDVFNMAKDVQVVFGKEPGSQHVPNDTNRHAPMWKKSIFWQLPYWQVLEVYCV